MLSNQYDRTRCRRAGLSGFAGHNIRDTFATLVTEESGDLTLAMQLIRDKVPGVALRYVQRGLPTLLERYSPVQQLERKPSPQMGESGVLVVAALAESLDKPFARAVGFFFGNTELSLELWNMIAGISGFDDS